MTAGYKAFEMGVPSGVIHSQQQFMEQQERSARILRQLRESDRILDLLRPVSAKPRKIDEPTITKWMKVMDESESSGVHEYPDDSQCHLLDPMEYFSMRFPDQTGRFGPAFFGSSAVGLTRTIFIPDSINEDLFAAILGGDRRLGHQVVWSAEENTFYYYDFRKGAFCQTTEEKLNLLTSNWLIRCSQMCHDLSARGVLKLRNPQSFRAVISTAKAMLMADDLFFRGNNGHRRFIQGKYLEPDAIPAYKLFVKKALVRDPKGHVTVGDAFAVYTRFCDNIHTKPLTRAEFKDLVKEAIREEYQISLRHDVIDRSSGKQGHGWRGINVALTKDTYALN